MVKWLLLWRKLKIQVILVIKLSIFEKSIEFWWCSLLLFPWFWCFLDLLSLWEYWFWYLILPWFTSLSLLWWFFTASFITISFWNFWFSLAGFTQADIHVSVNSCHIKISLNYILTNRTFKLFWNMIFSKLALLLILFCYLLFLNFLKRNNRVIMPFLHILYQKNIHCLFTYLRRRFLYNPLYSSC